MPSDIQGVHDNICPSLQGVIPMGQRHSQNVGVELSSFLIQGTLFWNTPTLGYTLLVLTNTLEVIIVAVVEKPEQT
jgi:hypothetical protein